MCGIVGYLGNGSAYEYLINGLIRLEYRGYDSAGIALSGKGKDTKYIRGKKSPTDFQKELWDIEKEINSPQYSIGIGHNRWATHGPPCIKNAHPHASHNDRYYVVHNGIIENHDEIQARLEAQGCKKRSDTDSECFALLLGHIANKNEKASPIEIVQEALKEIRGTYAFVIMDTQNPEILIAACFGSELHVAHEGENFYVTSSKEPLLSYSDTFTHISDGQIAIMQKGKNLRIISEDSKSHGVITEKLDISQGDIDLSGYAHYMLKEIFDQPTALKNALRGRLKSDGVVLGGIREYEDEIIKAPLIYIVGCGTSLNAGMIGEHYIQEMTGIPVKTKVASEFTGTQPIKDGDFVIGITQSGNTADTLEALRYAKEHGATILGINNVVGSAISRLTDAGVYVRAGAEISVASTKAFTSQVMTLYLVALSLYKKQHGMTKRLHSYINQIEAVEALAYACLERAEAVKDIAEKYAEAENVIFLGKGVNHPVAEEAALKLLEVSYIHAQGKPAAEIKHGPIALIEPKMPTVIIMPKNTALYNKVLANAEEIKGRDGKVIAVTCDTDTRIESVADDVIRLPECEELIYPIVAAIPMQLLAYYIAVKKGHNPDKPRNLAKSVTV